jgi:hypothetical protein
LSVRRKNLLVLGVFPALVCAWLACGPKGFQDSALVNGVRILATRSDRPYAKPGDTVNLSVLVDDGRSSQPEPMVIYWFPVAVTPPLSLPLPKASFVCEDPKDDAYFACFASLLSAIGDAGARADGASGDGGMPGLSLGPGVDLSSFLPQGPTFSVPISKDIIENHPLVSGTQPYGVALVFNMACAGHPELLPVDSSNLSFNQLPVGCFDKHGRALDADSFVVGYATIYVYDTLTNDNPVIAHLLYQGKFLDGGYLGHSSTADAGVPDEGGIVVPACTDTDRDACATYTFNIDVPSTSWQTDPQNIGPNGQPLHEQVWVDYYWTAGDFSDNSRLIYDPTVGAVGKTGVSLTPPAYPTTATFWAVVHDNRGGVAWDVVPYRVK